RARCGDAYGHDRSRRSRPAGNSGAAVSAGRARGGVVGTRLSTEVPGGEMRLSSYSPRAAARRSPLANAAIALLTIGALVGFVAIGLQAPNSIPGRSYYTVTAELSDAANVGPHTSVRIGGVRVGQVLNPRFEHGRPVVDLQL